MPGTNDLKSLHIPFTQRAIIVRANIVDGVKFAINIENDDRFFIDLYEDAAAWGNIGLVSDIVVIINGCIQAVPLQLCDALSTISSSASFTP